MYLVDYGNWIVREIEQPAGFVLDDTSYEVIPVLEWESFMK